MEKELFIKKMNSMKFISHRLGFLMTKYPENSIEVLHEIFNNKEMLNACSGFEFDICFTKDHIPVVIHDKYIDDISDSKGLVSLYTIEELKKIKFSFRKSINTNYNHSFYIVTLREILNYFSDNLNLLKDKIIKIETKDAVILKKDNMITLAKIFNDYPQLSSNIVHLSFYPTNLIILKKVQKEFNYTLLKSDLLCDYRIITLLTKFFKNIDLVSLRIKTRDKLNISKNNSRRVNKKIFLDAFFMIFSNALSDKTIRKLIDKHGSVGIYVLNDENDINEFIKHISDETFIKYADKIYFTSDNPLYLKKYKIK